MDDGALVRAALSSGLATDPGSAGLEPAAVVRRAGRRRRSVLGATALAVGAVAVVGVLALQPGGTSDDSLVPVATPPVTLATADPAPGPTAAPLGQLDLRGTALAQVSGRTLITADGRRTDFDATIGLPGFVVWASTYVTAYGSSADGSDSRLFRVEDGAAQLIVTGARTVVPDVQRGSVLFSTPLPGPRTQLHVRVGERTSSGPTLDGDWEITAAANGVAFLARGDEPEPSRRWDESTGALSAMPGFGRVTAVSPDARAAVVTKYGSETCVQVVDLSDGRVLRPCGVGEGGNDGVFVGPRLLAQAGNRSSAAGDPQVVFLDVDTGGQTRVDIPSASGATLPVFWSGAGQVALLDQRGGEARLLICTASGCDAPQVIETADDGFVVLLSGGPA